MDYNTPQSRNLWWYTTACACLAEPSFLTRFLAHYVASPTTYECLYYATEFYFNNDPQRSFFTLTKIILNPSLNLISLYRGRFDLSPRTDEVIYAAIASLSRY